MDSSASFGGTVTSGIQDISALLPLLGTEQCEAHIASSLVGGFIYAAATPLSIFGSLGLVRAGSKAFMASVVFSFRGKKVMGATILADMGLEPTGKVLSQIMWDGECHVAEKQLARTLDELHITDVKKVTVGTVTRRWNWWILVTSFIALILSTTPYILLVLSDPLSGGWFFPLARSLGSLVVSTTVQILIQTRLLEIVKHRIIFLTLNDFIRDRHIKLPSDSDSSPSEWWDARFSSEAALHRLGTYLKSHRKRSDEKRSYNPFTFFFKLIKKQDDEDSMNLPLISPYNSSLESSLESPLQSLEVELNNAKQKHLATTPHLRRTILAAQILVACGMMFTIIGYIGCFSLVQGSPNLIDPVIWLFVELGLSLLRMALWAWNPAWDEKQTYITFSLDLARHSPLSTCNTFYEDLEKEKDIPLTPSGDFLGTITSFVGSVEPLKVADGVALYYTMTRSKSNGQRVLYATMVDYRVDISWTLVCPSQSSSQIDRRVARVHWKGGDISTVWATLDKLPTGGDHITVDRTFIVKLKAHCEIILQKLRMHTVLDALVHALTEVLSERSQNRAQELRRELMERTREGSGLSEEVRKFLSTGLEARLLDILAVLHGPGQVLLRSHAEPLKQVVALSQALKQSRSRQQVQQLAQLAKQALRQALALSDQGPGEDLRTEEPQAQEAEVVLVLAEVVVLGLVLAQWQEQQRIGQLAEVISEVVALGEDEYGHQSREALDRVLAVVLVLKMRGSHVWEQAQAQAAAEVQTEVQAQVQVQARAQERAQAWAQAQVQAQAKPAMEMQVDTYADADARAEETWAQAQAVMQAAVWTRTLARTQTRTRMLAMMQERKRMQVDTQPRPPLNIRLTWALRPMDETERVDKTWRTGEKQESERPVTDDDLDDITCLKVGELELCKERLYSKKGEQIPLLVAESLAKLPSISETLECRGKRLKWAEDTMSGKMIVEILILHTLHQTEWMMVEESSEFEDILRWCCLGVVDTLKYRRGRHGEAAKIADDQKANAKRRVTEETADAQQRLEELKKEAHTRFKEDKHSDQTAALLESLWQHLQDTITKAWIQLTKRVEAGSKARLETRTYNLDMLYTLARPRMKVQMKAWLEGERETMQESLRKASINELGNSEASTFLLHLLLSKNSKFVRLPSDQDEENNFVAIAAILKLNTAVSCVDCSACALDEVIEVISSSSGVKSVTLILPEVLDNFKLETALRESKNRGILSLNSPNVPDSLKWIMQDSRMAAEAALKRGDNPVPLVYYADVEMDHFSSHLVFAQSGKSRCTVVFSVPSKDIDSGAATRKPILQLLHRRSSSYVKVDICLNGDTNEVLWEQDNFPQDNFGLQDIVLSRSTLHAGVNTLTITLKSDGVYRMRDVQLVWMEEDDDLEAEDESEGVELGGEV